MVYQSNNLNRYKEVVDILIEKCAYVCKGEELEEDRKYRNQKLEKENTVVRFKIDVVQLLLKILLRRYKCFKHST